MAMCVVPAAQSELRLACMVTIYMFLCEYGV